MIVTMLPWAEVGRKATQSRSWCYGGKAGVQWVVGNGHAQKLGTRPCSTMSHHVPPPKCTDLGKVHMNLTNAISGKHVEGIPLGHTHINPRKARVPGREAFLGSETCANCRGPKLSQTDGEKKWTWSRAEGIHIVPGPSIHPSLHSSIHLWGTPEWQGQQWFERARGSHLPLNHLGSHLPLNEGGWSGFRGECDPRLGANVTPAFAWQAQ